MIFFQGWEELWDTETEKKLKENKTAGLQQDRITHTHTLTHTHTFPRGRLKSWKIYSFPFRRVQTINWIIA